MAIEILMPKFGLSMEEGTIGAWLVKEGDTVQKGQAIAEVASEKLSNDATAPEDGVIAKLLIEEGDTLPCGEPIAILAADGEDAGAAAPAEKPAPAPEAAPVPVAAASASAPAVSAAPAGDVKITPRAKKIAEAKGLAYAHITGTGRHSFITIEDLKREGTPVAAGSAATVVAAPAPVSGTTAAPAVAPTYTPAAAGAEVVKLSPMQSAVCSGMYQSIQTTAQVTIMTEANVQPLTGVYASLKGKYTAAGFKLSYTAMLIKAVAMALENHPGVRMRLVDDAHYTVMQNLDIGVAVDVPGGLIVPVIRSANLKDLRTICAELADLSSRAKTGRLTEDEMGSAVITITNLGMFGITYFTPVLNLPEPCILGAGAITQKPVARDGGIFTDSVMNLSLTHDHRIINGAPAARFLQEVSGNLANFGWM